MAGISLENTMAGLRVLASFDGEIVSCAQFATKMWPDHAYPSTGKAAQAGMYFLNKLVYTMVAIKTDDGNFVVSDKGRELFDQTWVK